MAESQGSLPGAPPNTPGFPQNPLPIVFDGFTTLNTHPTRPAIEDQDMYICDGFIPLGKSNLRTLPGVGTALYTATGGKTIVDFAFSNLGSNAICMVFLSDGSFVQVNAVTGAVTAVAPSGTILNPTNFGIGSSQWGNQYIIISSSQANGFYLWDGTHLYYPGGLGPVINITSGGFDYTTSPTVTVVGGAGSGATVSASVLNGAVTSISVLNPGINYAYTDSVYLAFSGGGSNTTAQGTAVISSGTISSISITNAGTGYTSTTSVSISGGAGSGATGSVAVTSGTITSVSLINHGEGYTSSPTVAFADGNNIVAQATATLMPFGVSGTQIETFTSRLWVCNGAKILFTAAGNPTDFNPNDGAGAFTSYDSFLRVSFQQLIQTNGFLYLLADSSINYVSGVQTAGSPPITTFTNQNVDPQIGTPWPNTVQVFSRNIVFANSFGVHVSYGGAVTKVSSQMDYFFSNASLFNNFQPSAAVAVLYGIHVYVLLLPAIDQVSGLQVNKLLMWDGQRWWTGEQEPNLIQIGSQEINSVLTAWGTDGTKLYPLFQNPSTSLMKTVQSKLWDSPGYYFTKVSRRLFGLLNYNAVTSLPVTLTVDNGTSGTETIETVSGPTLTWTNILGQTIVWTGLGGNPLVWSYAGLSVFGFAVAQPGPLLGVTLQTNAPDLTVISLTLVEQIQSTNL